MNQLKLFIFSPQTPIWAFRLSWLLFFAVLAHTINIWLQPAPILRPHPPAPKTTLLSIATGKALFSGQAIDWRQLVLNGIINGSAGSGVALISLNGTTKAYQVGQLITTDLTLTHVSAKTITLNHDGQSITLELPQPTTPVLTINPAN